MAYFREQVSKVDRLCFTMCRMCCLVLAQPKVKEGRVTYEIQYWHVRGEATVMC